jgi:hypothetical protein
MDSPVGQLIILDTLRIGKIIERIFVRRDFFIHCPIHQLYFVHRLIKNY